MISVTGRKFSPSNTIIIAVLGIITLVSIAPIINTIAISFSEKSKAAAGIVFLWPVNFTTASYAKLLSDSKFARAFLISVERIVIGGSINMILTIIMAYPLSKEREAFKYRNIYMWVIVFTLLFNGGLIPWYMTIRSLKMLDTIWALVLPGAVPVFNLILLMNFFRGIPKELEEAAVIDGAGKLYTLVRIYLPMSVPALATLSLFSIIGHWNSFFDGLILMNKPQNYPLQTYIQQLVAHIDITNIRDQETLRQLLAVSNRTFNAAKIVVSMLPILIIYPFLQRFFISGIVLGSIKG